ncbi:hypothetical protein CIHG_09077 [Coccidioides immitis H538.4]|uniref:Uncharacterized protein n=1 Tax=Coccidioides immitis H538.4 TaxID=396776 RepID=A0A0J8S1L3_COCIT|nr:hypothetical protein CIHG_09077 [Coccidioides immitis H538.4]
MASLDDFRESSSLEYLVRRLWRSKSLDNIGVQESLVFRDGLVPYSDVASSDIAAVLGEKDFGCGSLFVAFDAEQFDGISTGRERWTKAPSSDFGGKVPSCDRPGSDAEDVASGKDGMLLRLKMDLGRMLSASAFKLERAWRRDFDGDAFLGDTVRGAAA